MKLPTLEQPMRINLGHLKPKLLPMKMTQRNNRLPSTKSIMAITKNTIKVIMGSLSSKKRPTMSLTTHWNPGQMTNHGVHLNNLKKDLDH